MEIIGLLKEYLKTLDDALLKLSNLYEGNIYGLPSWVLCNRKINIAKVNEEDIFLVKLEPSDSIDEDVYYIQTIDASEMNSVFSPMVVSAPLDILRKSCFLYADVKLSTNEHYKSSVQLLSGLFAIGPISGFVDTWSYKSALKDANEFWNHVIFNLTNDGTYIDKLKEIFRRYSTMIKRKDFKERRIHRYINQHGHIFLPPHKRLLFEHKIYHADTYYKADFILEREVGFKPILIELEDPAHVILTKNGDFRACVNHAKEQINRWVNAIEMEEKNKSGDLEFLAGPKDRLVVIGRGLEHADKLIETRHSDTVVWTYTLLGNEARQRCNNIIKHNAQIIGFKDPDLIPSY